MSIACMVFNHIWWTSRQGSSIAAIGFQSWSNSQCVSVLCCVYEETVPDWPRRLKKAYCVCRWDIMHPLWDCHNGIHIHDHHNPASRAEGKLHRPLVEPEIVNLETWVQVPALPLTNVMLASHVPSLAHVVLIYKMGRKSCFLPASLGCSGGQMSSWTLKERICPLRKVDVCEGSHPNHLKSFPIQGHLLTPGKWPTISKNLILGLLHPPGHRAKSLWLRVFCHSHWKHCHSTKDTLSSWPLFGEVVSLNDARKEHLSPLCGRTGIDLAA